MHASPYMYMSLLYVCYVLQAGLVDVVIVVVGNKVDLEQERLVDRELAAEVALEILYRQTTSYQSTVS